ncbi:tRNA uridine 5-carboxymethylaminomethyl modification protein [Bacteroidales bacterium]|nr:tRNA uridine 5-carboxymethylaminomethyl modification protein [Bacteroidales bacterium]
MKFDYDVIVIGGGHAGCEAAVASANLGSRTLLITMDMNKIGQMSCNPAVGGIAKGQLVREIDALGGFMGLVTDKTAIQFRMLNRSKGPAMWSPRAQSDRVKFIEAWKEVLDNTPNLFIWQDTVKELLFKDGAVCGLLTAMDVTFRSKAIVLTVGTFLNGLLHIGKTQLAGGRISEPASYGLTDQLREKGFRTDRMKTGTPVRIDARSVDFSLMEEQVGEDDFHKFSYLNNGGRILKQMSCWATYTNESCHQILSDSLKDSPLYNGQIKSIGPRYCPSIETKIVTFSDKSQHQLFLEPEGLMGNEYYLNGFSSSLPLQAQIDALVQIPAFRNIHVYRPGYAIEYDFFDPTQLLHSLETKSISNLFFAGQINGTTGYEEAGAQGIVAGINAHINVHGGSAFTLARNEAYIGVLIDDLVTKGVDEPYRMFTSRAEYRILLRQDNADFRLTPRSYDLGLASKGRFSLLESKQKGIQELLDYSKAYKIRPDLVNEGLLHHKTSALQKNVRLLDLILRPQLSIFSIAEFVPDLKAKLDEIRDRKEEIVEAAEILMKYEGYIVREQLIADKLSRLENVSIKGKINYDDLQSLSTEAKEKLNKIQPETIAQAGRIPGITPHDLNVLLVMLGR